MRTSQSRRDGELVAIGFDVGGTKIAAGVVTQVGRVLFKQVVPTPDPADAVTLQRTLIGITRELKESFRHVSAIGVGAAGLIDWPSGHIRWAPNSAYRDLALQHVLSAELGLPAAVENDANAAAWAEACIGAGVGHQNVIVLTLGTGIGGGIVLGGALYRGQSGLGGEVGHLIVNPMGAHQCGCGATGCLETMASGTALGRLGHAAAVAAPDGAIASIAGSIERVTGETVFQAAREGDSVACELFTQVGYWLGIGIASLVTVFDPGIVVLTGGLITASDLFLPSAQDSFERFVFAGSRRTLPPIVRARLDTDAGLIGAALLALDYQSKRPGCWPTERRY